MTTIFVYGTLKRSYGNWERYLKDRDGVAFLGEAVSLDKNFVMNDVGFPLLYDVGATAGSYVVGELFEVDAEALADLDRLEGYPSFYHREPRRFFNKATGRVVRAEIYITNSVRLTRGDWWVIPRDYHVEWRPILSFSEEDWETFDEIERLAIEENHRD